MPWVKFKENFDYVPADEPRVTLAFKAGEIKNVPTPCAEKAIDLKSAVKAKRSAKEKDASRDT